MNPYTRAQSMNMVTPLRVEDLSPDEEQWRGSRAGLQPLHFEPLPELWEHVDTDRPFYRGDLIEYVRAHRRIKAVVVGFVFLTAPDPLVVIRKVRPDQGPGNHWLVKGLTNVYLFKFRLRRFRVLESKRSSELQESMSLLERVGQLL